MYIYETNNIMGPGTPSTKNNGNGDNITTTSKYYKLRYVPPMITPTDCYIHFTFIDRNLIGCPNGI